MKGYLVRVILGGDDIQLCAINDYEKCHKLSVLLNSTFDPPHTPRGADTCFMACVSSKHLSALILKYITLCYIHDYDADFKVGSVNYPISGNGEFDISDHLNYRIEYLDVDTNDLSISLYEAAERPDIDGKTQRWINDNFPEVAHFEWDLWCDDDLIKKNVFNPFCMKRLGLEYYEKMFGKINFDVFFKA